MKLRFRSPIAKLEYEYSSLKADHFVRSEEKAAPAEPLAMISTYLRSDPNLTAEAATALDELVKAAYGRLRKPK